MIVSAVIPVYNGADFVAEAIESVYAQTRLPDEVIVVDDGSTDATPDVLRQFRQRPGFRALRQENGGEASARNVGIAAARGEYVALLDHDDVWRPRKLERHLAHLRPEWAFSFTAHELRSTTSTEVERYEKWDPDARAVQQRLEREPPLWPASSALVRREVFEQLGGFKKVDPFGDDWLMWLRIAAAGHPVGYLDEVLTEYRWHGGNQSYEERGYFKAACAVFDRYGDDTLRAEWRLRAARFAHRDHNPWRARRQIIEAALIKPSRVRPDWIRLFVGPSGSTA